MHQPFSSLQLRPSTADRARRLPPSPVFWSVRESFLATKRQHGERSPEGTCLPAERGFVRGSDRLDSTIYKHLNSLDRQSVSNIKNVVR
jgi:hypothetical protein